MRLTHLSSYPCHALHSHQSICAAWIIQKRWWILAGKRWKRPWVSLHLLAADSRLIKSTLDLHVNSAASKDHTKPNSEACNADGTLKDAKYIDWPDSPSKAAPPPLKCLHADSDDDDLPAIIAPTSKKSHVSLLPSIWETSGVLDNSQVGNNGMYKDVNIIEIDSNSEPKKKNAKLEATLNIDEFSPNFCKPNGTNGDKKARCECRICSWVLFLLSTALNWPCGSISEGWGCVKKPSLIINEATTLHCHIASYHALSP